MRDAKLVYIMNKLSELQCILEEICNECNLTKSCSECLLTKAKRDLKTIKSILEASVLGT